MAALVALCAVTGVLLSGVPAQAAVTHEYLSRITEVPVGSGAAVTGPLRQLAVAADASGVYVVDHGGHTNSNYGQERLDEFDASSGAFVAQLYHHELQYKEVGELGLGENIAVDHSTGDLYIDAGKLIAPAHEEFEKVVAVFAPGGSLLGEPWTGADTPLKAFGKGNSESGHAVTGVAVDNNPSKLSDWAAGDVYVADGDVDFPNEPGAVDVFEPLTGGGERYVTQLTESEPGVPLEPTEVAVDPLNGDVLVVDGGQGDSIDVFEPTVLEKYVFVRRLTGTPGGPFEGVHDIAVNEVNADLYVLTNEGFGTVVDQFSAEGKYLGQVTGTPGGAFPESGDGFHESYSIAVGDTQGAEDLYVSDATRESQFVDVFSPNIVIPNVETEPASEETPFGATVHGKVGTAHAGEATCQFVWGTSPGELDHAAPCEPEAVGEGEEQPVLSRLTGLQPDTTYYYRLQATNRASGHANPGESSQTKSFATDGPDIHDESVADVASTSVTFDATINPDGAPTSYYFQYGTSPSYGAEVPAAPGLPIGSGAADVAVGSEHVQELLPDTVYHYRVVAVSELKPDAFEVFDGADQTFTTQSAGSSLELLDDRQWEMVSPPDKLGADVIFEAEDGAELMQSSADGEVFTYLTTAPTEADPQGYDDSYEQVLALRGPNGWSSENLDVSRDQPLANGRPEYPFFSEDLSLAAVEPIGTLDPSLSPEASEQTALLRTDFLNGGVDEPCLPLTMRCFRPLVTGKPGYANVPPGTVFGLEDEGHGRACGLTSGLCGPEFVEGTPDLSHVVIKSEVPLTSGGNEGEVYEWAAGELTPVPGVQPAIGVEHGLSDDGSRVIGEGTGALAEDLVMRDIPKDETIELDAAQGGAESGEGAFGAASTTGSRVFFTDRQALTADSGAYAGQDAADLYLCEMVEEGGKLSCKLSDLTPGGVGHRADVLAVLGASEDGSYVYFVTDGVLAAGEGAVRGTCTRNNQGVAGQMCNLYVWHDGQTRLVTVLSGTDYPAWQGAGLRPGNKPVRVSPDGQWLAFMSDRNLTGYDTSDAISGEPDEEVYLYDAAGAGRLVCASCDPTGARPVAVQQRVAANIPAGAKSGYGEPRYQPRVLFDGGRLFFDSSDPLVPQDVNGAKDAYEYEPPEVGSCTTGSATYGERSGGCVDLISSGTSAVESRFLDASEDGRDAFFATAAQLAPQDRDTVFDVYEARECLNGRLCYPPPATAPPPCTTGDACKAAPTPQPTFYGAPASATFSGAGNVSSGSAPASGGSKSTKTGGLTRAQRLQRALRACRRERSGRRRGECERRARARYARRSRKDGTNGRSGR